MTTQRSLLTGPTTICVGPGQTYPHIRDAISDLQQNFDLGGQDVAITTPGGGYIDPGFRLSGLLVGQRGMFGLVLLMGAGDKIVPSGRACGIALDSGAMMCASNVFVDGTVQAATGPAQDCIQLGQASHIALYGRGNTIWNAAGTDGLGMNGITWTDSSTVEIMPQSWGSQQPNGAELHIGGVFQDVFQTDSCASFRGDNNDAHGLIAIYADAIPGHTKVTSSVAFFDIANGLALISGIDFHGSADGYRFRGRKYATLDTNKIADPNQFNAIPGSAGVYPGFDGQYLIL